MKAKTKFTKWFYKAPEKARRELVFEYWKKRPYSLNIIMLEIRNDTKLGKEFLKKLGFEDD